MRKLKILNGILLALCVITISAGSYIYYNKSKAQMLNNNVSQVENEEKKKVEKKRVTFVGVGDNLIHDSIYNAADRREGYFRDGKYNFDHLYENIKSDIEKYDLKYINVESIIGGDKLGIHTYPRFNTPESMIPSLKKAGFNVINMANNHSLDMGANGIINSINLWDKENVYHSGVFKSEEDRNKPVIMEKNGIKIAFLCYTYGTNGFMPDKDWRVSYLKEDKVRADIARVKPLADFILVSTHWGEEGHENLDGYQIKFSKFFNELGVDVVLGTHAHRIQKVEWLTNKDNKKTLVYYGTGNFVHNMIPTITYLEAMASFDFVKDGDKKYIENAKFTPLVFHIERNKYGFDGTVYRLDKYPKDLARKHIYIGGNYNYHVRNYVNVVKKLVPQNMISLDEKYIDDNFSNVVNNVVRPAVAPKVNYNNSYKKKVPVKNNYYKQNKMKYNSQNAVKYNNVKPQNKYKANAKQYKKPVNNNYNKVKNNNNIQNNNTVKKYNN